MALPDGEFVLVLNCADCGAELNRSRVITAREYTQAVLTGPLCTKPCPRGCRSTFSDMNMNTRQRFERPDGTLISLDEEIS